MVASGAAVGVVAETAPATAATTVFSYTGAEQTYIVPAGVHELFITAFGAPGGKGHDGAGGGAAVVSATVPVIPGTTLYVEVGGRGGDGGGGGFNGGGHGVAGGGGGASDVRTQPRSVALSTNDSRLVVAGGGGGTSYGYGGVAGHDTVVGAGDGGKGSAVSLAGDGGAGGLGGPAGTGGLGKLGPDGHDGKLGSGGDSSWMAGGGGGGGYYGGGGGGGGPFGGGGGAGSSYWVPSARGSMWGHSAFDPAVEISPTATATATATLLKADVAGLHLPRGIAKTLQARVAEIRAAVVAGDRDLVLASLDRLLGTVEQLRGNVLRHSADQLRILLADAAILRGFYTP